jgi:hypothetical protein
VAGATGLTVAVKVAVFPLVDGFWEEIRAIVVLAGKIVNVPGTNAKV